MKLLLKLYGKLIAGLETRRQSSGLQLSKKPGTASSFIENSVHLLIHLYKLLLISIKTEFCLQLKAKLPN